MAAPTSKQAFLANINATNADSELAKLTENDLIFGQPQVIASGNYNTSIVLTAKPSDSLFGSRTFQYPRLELGIYLTSPPAVTLSAGAKFKDLLPAINAANRTGLQAEDLENAEEVLPPLSPVPTVVVVKAASRSIVWIGEMNVSVASAKTDIEALLPNGDLPGLVYKLPIDVLLPNNTLPGFSFRQSIDDLLPVSDLPGLTYRLPVAKLLPVGDLPGLIYP